MKLIVYIYYICLYFIVYFFLVYIFLSKYIVKWKSLSNYYDYKIVYCKICNANNISILYTLINQNCITKLLCLSTFISFLVIFYILYKFPGQFYEQIITNILNMLLKKLLILFGVKI